jgi:large subunit ribosomal protein L6
MSRLGKIPVELPSGVEVRIEGQTIKVKGPKGELCQNFSEDIGIKVDGSMVVLESLNPSRETKANHGLYRSLVQNMVTGVSTGFIKELMLEGVGYRVAAVKNKLTLTLGFCHPIDYFVHPEIKVTLEGNTQIKLESSDKQLLGQVAAEIRSLRKPEPYKGKGIRYSDEVIRKKVGKAASK